MEVVVMLDSRKLADVDSAFTQMQVIRNKSTADQLRRGDRARPYSLLQTTQEREVVPKFLRRQTPNKLGEGA